MKITLDDRKSVELILNSYLDSLLVYIYLHKLYNIFNLSSLRVDINKHYINVMRIATVKFLNNFTDFKLNYVKSQ